MKVIINADDLGLNHRVNEAIDLALTDSVITSSTILANTNYWDEVLCIVKKHPHASFGIHLNLTEGKSLMNSPILKKYGLLDDRGFFLRGIHNIEINDELRAAIYEEWDQQIRTVIEKGVSITHFDGHHHVHTLYGLEFVLVKLGQKYGVNRTRNKYHKPFSIKNKIVGAGKPACKNMSTVKSKSENYSSSNKNKILKRFKNILGSYLKYVYWKSVLIRFGVKSPNYFDSYNMMCNHLENKIMFSSNAIVELMCHPGHPSYLDEMELVKCKKINTYISNIEYISYKELV